MILMDHWSKFAFLCRADPFGRHSMKKLLLVGLLLCVAAFVGCGGSSGSSGGGGNVTPSLTTVQVTPAIVSLTPGQTQQYKATGTYSDGSTKDLTGSANWLSSSSTVATINTTGMATAVAGGASNITASVSGVTGSTSLSVVALTSITVTPGSATVGVNGTQAFTATGNYSDGSQKNITATVTWSASAGATITTAGVATGKTAGATSTITAASGSVSGSATLNVGNALVSIVVTPSGVSLAPNATQQYTAMGTYADSSTKNITSSVTWSASTGATITAGGLATAVTANSTVTIMATDTSGISGSTTLTVTNPLVSIAVTPANPSIAAGTNQQFIATGTYADNSTQVLTSTATWASSNTGVATISNSPGTQGLASALAAGPTNITASYQGVTSPADVLTVTSATLLSIAVTPANQQIVFQTQQQYTAIGTFSDTTTQDITGSVTWASSDTAHLTITNTGLATGVAAQPNPITISATKGSVSNSTTATVVAATVSSIAITPGTATLANGTSRQYTAIATLANGSTLNVTSQASWSTSNPSAATVGIHTGLVKGAAAGGTSTITATYNGVSSNFVLTVNVVTVNSLTVTPVSPTIPVGVSQRFSATAVFSDSSVQDITLDATWGSSNTGVATVSTIGNAFSFSSGSTTITAGFGGATGSATLNVDTATLSSVVVTPSSTVLPAGKTIIYQAYGNYSDGSQFVLTSLATWASDAPSIVSVTTGGVASTQSPGTANITASYKGITSTNSPVIVTSFPLVSIAVSPKTASIPAGVATQFTAVGTFSDGSTQSLTAYATWAASPSSIATITNLPGVPGQATGVSQGVANVTAVFAGIVNTPPSALTVTTATITSIAVTPANPVVTHGNQLTFKAVGSFSDGSQIDLTSQVNWSSSNVTVATISTTGVCSTAAAGTSVITATFGGVNGTANLTVN
jgi:hypothetical protein